MSTYKYVALRWWKTLESWERTRLAYKYGIYDDSGYDCHRTIIDREIVMMWKKERMRELFLPIPKQVQEENQDRDTGVFGPSSNKVGISSIPKKAVEGLQKLGEKIGDSEWDEIVNTYLDEKYGEGAAMQPHPFFNWLKKNYYPPKPKKNGT